MTSKPTVKLKILEEIYAVCKYRRMNCTVTQLTALTFCIVTLSTVIGWEGGGGLNSENIQYLEFSFCEYACPFSERLRIPRFCDRNKGLLSWALLPSFILSYKNSCFYPKHKLFFLTNHFTGYPNKTNYYNFTIHMFKASIIIFKNHIPRRNYPWSRMKLLQQRILLSVLILTVCEETN